MMVPDAEPGLSWTNRTFADPDTGYFLVAVDYSHIRIHPSGFHTPVAVVAVGHRTEPSSSAAAVVGVDNLALEPDSVGLALDVACTYRCRFAAFEDMDCC